MLDQPVFWALLGVVATIICAVPAYFTFFTGRASLPAYFDVAESLRDASKSVRLMATGLLDLSQGELIDLSTPLVIRGVEGQCKQILVVKQRRGLSVPRVSGVFDAQSGSRRREIVLHYLEHDAELVRFSENARLLVVSGTRQNGPRGGKFWDLNIVDLKNMRAAALRVNASWAARGVSDPLEILGIQIRSGKLITADIRMSCYCLNTDSEEHLYFGGTVTNEKGENRLGAPRGLKASVGITLSSGLRIESLSKLSVADEDPYLLPTN